MKPHILPTKARERNPQTLCAAVGFADGIGGGIQSQNIVGYNTVTLKPGYNMLALNFQSVSNATKGISIQDMIPGKTEGLKFGPNAVSADTIMVYNPENAGYTSYFLYKNARKEDAKDYNWCSLDSGYPIADKIFKNGDAFWYLSQGEKDISVAISGAVAIDASATVEIAEGYNMIANAFPVNFNPNALGVDYWKSAIAAGASAGPNAVSADTIMVYDPETTGYTSYFLYKNARKEDAKDYKWCSMDSGYPAIDPTAECISVGKGVWYLHQGETTFKLTIPSPLTK